MIKDEELDLGDVKIIPESIFHQSVQNDYGRKCFTIVTN